MKVKVKLSGTLSQKFPGYDHLRGFEVEIPDEATVKNLLTVLGISYAQGVTVIMEGRVLKEADMVQHGEPVYILQAIQGG
jgi:sulfur carrier protein ThiS